MPYPATLFFPRICYRSGVMGKNRAAARVCAALGFACGLATGASAQDLSFGYSNFGGPGMIDMPVAFSRTDAELGFNAIWFQNTRRFPLSFQLTPRLSTTFRYSQLYEINETGDQDNVIFQDFVFDRSFGLHYRFADEGQYRPAMAVGINDFLGTGFFEGEYVVASKSFSDRLHATFGIGWGRYGGVNSFDNPLSFLGTDWDTRGARTTSLTGGEVDSVEWFRGPAAFFGGIEWKPTDRLRVIAEYSSDDYIYEDGFAFTQNSPLNFGVGYPS